MGVQVLLPKDLRDASITISNKPAWIIDDRAAVAEVLRVGRCTPAAMRKLRGRLTSLTSQTFGRWGAFASRMLRDLAEGAGGPRDLKPLERIGLEWIERFLRRPPPRKVTFGETRKHVVLLTDGAVEDVVTVGAVMFDPESGKLEYAGAEVPDHVARSWGRLSTEQVIGQAEIAPLAMAM